MITINEWPLQWIVIGMAMASRDMATELLTGDLAWQDNPRVARLARAIAAGDRMACMAELEQMGVSPHDRPSAAIVAWASEKNAEARRARMIADVSELSYYELDELLTHRSQSNG